MDKKPLITRRVLTITGAYLISTALKFAAELFRANNKYGQKTLVYDGYLIRATRSGRFGTAEVRDLPGYLLFPGYGRFKPEVDTDPPDIVEGSNFIGIGTRDTFAPGATPSLKLGTSSRPLSEAASRAQSGIQAWRPAIPADIATLGPSITLDPETFNKGAVFTAEDHTKYRLLKSKIMPAAPGELPAEVQIWVTASGTQLADTIAPDGQLDFFPFDLYEYGATDPFYRQKAFLVGQLPNLKGKLKPALGLAVHSDWVDAAAPGWKMFRRQTGGTSANPPYPSDFFVRLASNNSLRFREAVSQTEGARTGSHEIKAWMYPMEITPLVDPEGAVTCRWLVVVEVALQQAPITTTTPAAADCILEDYFGVRGLLFAEVLVTATPNDEGGYTSGAVLVSSEIWDPRDSVVAERQPFEILKQEALGSELISDPTQLVGYDCNYTDHMAAAIAPSGHVYLMHTFLNVRSIPDPDNPGEFLKVRVRGLNVFKYHTTTGLVWNEISTSPFLAQDYRLGCIMNGCAVTSDTVAFANTAGLIAPGPYTFTDNDVSDPVEESSNVLYYELDLAQAEIDTGTPQVHPFLLYVISPSGLSLVSKPAPGFVGYAGDHFRGQFAHGLAPAGPGKIAFMASTDVQYDTVAAPVPGRQRDFVDFNAVLVTYDIIEDVFTISQPIFDRAGTGDGQSLFVKRAGVPQLLTFNAGSPSWIVSTGPNILSLCWSGNMVSFGHARQHYELFYYPFRASPFRQDGGAGTIKVTWDAGTTWVEVSGEYGSQHGVRFAGNGYYSVPSPELL